ncbi:MAG: helix-turn-helix domain-containing protein [Isosphaeraceae bacterium]|nr:helix-turn-helix domain-containing protein [Isosphaeraceae bacterium]
MNIKAASSPPLKIEDLMERWGVSEEIIKEHIRKNGLPFWDAGTGNGRRPMYRFRLTDVEAWEESRRRIKSETPTEGVVPTPATGAPASWDGKLRGTGRGKGRGKASRKG